MTDRDLMLAGLLMPPDLSELAWVVAESRARGIECATDGARLFDGDELIAYLVGRVAAVRAEAVNRPPVAGGIA